MAAFEEILTQRAAEAGLLLTDAQIAQFVVYHEMLIDWNTRMNLTALTSPEDVAVKHIIDSLTAYDAALFDGAKKLIDVGTGAGLPGIVIAVCRPDLDVHLAEPMTRRCEWLADVVDALGLDNTTIHQARAEELRGKGKADVVTARAVANMAKLVRMTSKLIAPGGALVALKGRRVPIEIEEAASELKRHHLMAQIHEVPSVMEDESTYIVKCTRTK